MEDISRHRRLHFNKFMLPVSAALLVIIGCILTLMIYLEEAWHWHVAVPLPACCLISAFLIWYYKKGNEIIEISPDRIAVVSGNRTAKSLAYSDITVLKYNFVEGYTPPTIKLKGNGGTIVIDGEMENYIEAIENLARHLRAHGRQDLIDAYTQQFNKKHKVSY